MYRGDAACSTKNPTTGPSEHLLPHTTTVKLYVVYRTQSCSMKITRRMFARHCRDSDHPVLHRGFRCDVGTAFDICCGGHTELAMFQRWHTQHFPSRLDGAATLAFVAPVLVEHKGCILLRHLGSTAGRLLWQQQPGRPGLLLIKRSALPPCKWHVYCCLGCMVEWMGMQDFHYNRKFIQIGKIHYNRKFIQIGKYHTYIEDANRRPQSLSHDTCLSPGRHHNRMPGFTVHRSTRLLSAIP